MSSPRSKPVVRHLAGCPAERIESYEASSSRGTFTVTRCQDCGESTVKQETLTTVEPQEA